VYYKLVNPTKCNNLNEYIKELGSQLIINFNDSKRTRIGQQNEFEEAK
jgi:hypothetical protein